MPSWPGGRPPGPLMTRTPATSALLLRSPLSSACWGEKGWFSSLLGREKMVQQPGFAALRPSRVRYRLLRLQELHAMCAVQQQARAQDTPQNGWGCQRGALRHPPPLASAPASPQLPFVRQAASHDLGMRHRGPSSQVQPQSAFRLCRCIRRLLTQERPCLRAADWSDEGTLTAFAAAQPLSVSEISLGSSGVLGSSVAAAAAAAAASAFLSCASARCTAAAAAVAAGDTGELGCEAPVAARASAISDGVARGRLDTRRWLLVCSAACKSCRRFKRRLLKQRCAIQEPSRRRVSSVGRQMLQISCLRPKQLHPVHHVQQL